MTIRAVLTSTVLLTVTVGCAQEPASPAPAASGSSSAVSNRSVVPAVGETTTCAAQNGTQITINGSGISCDDAYTIASKYDLQGEKYQNIDVAGTWICYAGNVDSRPLIFQCASGQETEFAVYPAP